MNQKKLKKKKIYLDLKPHPILLKFLSQIPKGKVLDLGAGRGENALYLAKKGFRVEVIDINKQFLENLAKIVKNNNLNIKIQLINIKNFKFKPHSYASILAINSLSFLKKTEFRKIISKMKKALIKGGIIFISAFTTNDPAFRKFLKRNKMIEENTFYNKKTKKYWSFLGPGELKSYFQYGFKILFYKEVTVYDKAHLGAPYPHHHGLAKIIVKKESTFSK